MIYDVRHRTTFDYEQLVSVAHHVLHLMPRNSAAQQRIAFALHIDPEPSLSATSDDYFGNTVHYLTMQEPHARLVVEARSRIEVFGRNGAIDLGACGNWETVAAKLKAPGPDALDAQQFAFDSPYVSGGRAVREFALESFLPKRPLLDAAMDLTGRIFEEFEYQGGVSDVWTPVSRVLAMRSGVCQDFAHLAIACLRSLGLASRYVSGYLLTHPPEGREKLVGTDASHAWIALWADELGWIDFDPTNNVVPTVEHITVAWGRDYGDVSPTNGFIIGGGAHEVDVGVDVRAAA